MPLKFGKEPKLWPFFLVSLLVHALFLVFFSLKSRPPSASEKAVALNLVFSEAHAKQAPRPAPSAPRLPSLEKLRPSKLSPRSTTQASSKAFRLPEDLGRASYEVAEVSPLPAENIPWDLPRLPKAKEGGKALEARRADYLARVLALIDRAKVYPLRARLAGYQGRVSLSFVVEPDGEVREVRVLRSSGYPVLDRAAVKTVLKAAPFPPPPRDLDPPLTLSVKISFAFEE